MKVPAAALVLNVILRFPRLQKIHQDRTVKDTVSVSDSGTSETD
jgi:hypothetical protein